MDLKVFEELLKRSESETLDFKVSQYPFRNATDDEKSELLKDILSFANTERKTDAYILIGVAEIRGGKPRVDGITTSHLVDHELQQFVHQKVNKPIKFQYHEVEVSGKQCAAIQIPIQRQRPYYILKDFGKLHANDVYIRRGSSKDRANLDEVFNMARKPFPWVVQAVLLVSILTFASYWAYESKAEKEAKHDAPYETLVAQLKKSKVEKMTAEQDRDSALAEAKTYQGLWLSALATATNGFATSGLIKDAEDKIQKAWPSRSLTNASEEIEHIHEMATLDAARRKAEFLERFQRMYPIWQITLSKFKEMLVEPAKQFGGKVNADPLPSIEEIIGGGQDQSKPITIGTNLFWHARWQAGPENFFLDCYREKGIRTYLQLYSTPGQFQVRLRSEDLNQNQLPIFDLSTNCPLSSIESCTAIVNDSLQMLFADQQNQF